MLPANALGGGAANARQQQVVDMLAAQQAQGPNAAQQHNGPQMAVEAPGGNSVNAWQPVAPNSPMENPNDPVVPLGVNSQWDNFLANQGVTYLPQGAPQVNQQAQMVSPQYADVGTSMATAGQGSPMLQELLSQYLAQTQAQNPSNLMQPGNVAYGQDGPRQAWTPANWGH